MPVLLLGVTGGIAAYKAVELTSRLRQRGWEVRVVMTANAARFVTPLTFETIARRPVRTDTFDSGAMDHLDLARGVEVALVAPASANSLAKLAHGLADDLLSTAFLAVRAPILVAPAMNTAMWEHPATRHNLATLRARGVQIIDPQAEGELACGEFGAGKLAPVEAIVEALEGRLQHNQALAGRKVLVTAGGTREPIDPVRFVTNRSSGKMGHAMAAVARDRGAEVTLVTTRADDAPAGVALVPVDTAAELYEAVTARFAAHDVLVMTAAVADYRPRTIQPHKIKKRPGPWSLELEPTLDILAALAPSKRPDQFVVGFAAETQHLLENAHDKLARKGLDLIVANDVLGEGIGFESADNAVTVLGAEGPLAMVPRLPKREVAGRIWDVVQARTSRPAR